MEVDCDIECAQSLGAARPRERDARCSCARLYRDRMIQGAPRRADSKRPCFGSWDGTVCALREVRVLPCAQDVAHSGTGWRGARGQRAPPTGQRPSRATAGRRRKPSRRCVLGWSAPGWTNCLQASCLRPTGATGASRVFACRCSAFQQATTQTARTARAAQSCPSPPITQLHANGIYP